VRLLRESTVIDLRDSATDEFVILQVRGNDTWHDYAQIDAAQAGKFMEAATASGTADTWRIAPEQSGL